MGQTLEVQLGADSWGGQRVRGSGMHESAHGGGDGSIALKWAPVLATDAMTLAVKAGTTLGWGRAPLGGGGTTHASFWTCCAALPPTGLIRP